jgi:hypothetical protein
MYKSTDDYCATLANDSFHVLHRPSSEHFDERYVDQDCVFQDAWSKPTIPPLFF